MSSSEKNLTRKEIVTHLESLKIKPTNKLFQQEYIEYVSSKLSLDILEITSNIYKDISTIKGFFISAHSDVQRMINSHIKYFDVIVKPKRRVPSSIPTPPSPPTMPLSPPVHK